MTDSFTIRAALRDDLEHLRAISTTADTNKGDGDYLQRSLDEQDKGHRQYFILRHGQEYVGSVILNKAPRYKYFRHENIPEIQDLLVMPDHRRRGYGYALVAHCEDTARQAGYNLMGLGVGLTAGFGAAQRLYVKMGYQPDGFGLVYDRRSVAAGSYVQADDHLNLMMIKEL